MIRGIKVINNKNISIKNEIGNVKNIDYVDIPLKTIKNTEYICNVKIGDYVYKGDILGISSDKFKFPIHSSISGKIIDIFERKMSGDNIKIIKIENDYLEKQRKKIGSKNKINKYTKEEVLELMHNCSIVGLGGSSQPTYYKYSTELKIKTLIINAVESEPYITCDFAILNNKTVEILETIDALMEIFNIEKCIIAIKEFNKEGMKTLIEYIGSYPKIEIQYVNDIYPIGYEKSLIKYLLNISYNKYPMEKGIIVNNVSTIYSIYKALKYKKPITSRVITISGDGIKNQQNVKVKYGTNIKDIIEFVGGYKSKNVSLIINGPIKGYTISNDDYPITPDINGVVILKNKKIKRTECINCGKCSNICPVRLSPVIIMNNQNNKNLLKKLNPDKCIECGLCSYICPSKINLKKIVVCNKGVKK